jgi:hypothetical protein
MQRTARRAGPLRRSLTRSASREAGSISAPTTEISALLEAFVGLHRLCGCRGDVAGPAALPPADIFADCQFALDTVQMKCRASSSVELVHASRMLCAGLAPHPAMRKIPGHKGHIWQRVRGRHHSGVRTCGRPLVAALLGAHSRFAPCRSVHPGQFGSAASGAERRQQLAVLGARGGPC